LAQSPCTIVGIDDSNHEVALGTTGLRFYYIPNTGAIKTADSEAYNGSKKITKIRLKNNNGTKMDLVIHNATGKITVE